MSSLPLWVTLLLHASEKPMYPGDARTCNVPARQGEYLNVR